MTKVSNKKLTPDRMQRRPPLWWAIPILIWVLLLAVSFLWNQRRERRHLLDVARATSQSFFQEVQTTRQWNAQHGGVYVPVTEIVRPNPYLDVSHRDVTTSTGKALTLVNPAFMTRQISIIAAEKRGVRFHITSLNPIRPANKADGWETAALEGFEKGNTERIELLDDAGQGKIFRYMAPLTVNEACMKCHAKQGYRVGDIRGGISVTLPAGQMLSASMERTRSLGVLHVGIMIIGVIGIFIYLSHTRSQWLAIQASRQEVGAAEERFRSIVEGLKKEHFFYTHDTNGVFTYVSPSVTEVLGFETDLLLKPFESILTDNPVNEVARPQAELTLQGKQQPSYELEVFHNDGNPRILEVNNVPIFNGQGIVIGVGGVAHDITERKRMDESLKDRVDELANTRRAILNMMEDLEEARGKAEEATRAKSDFLANMSHEIRTPMNAVIGMTHLALKTELTSKQQDYLNKIQLSANALLGIINDILDFSKIEAGKLDMERVDFNLDDVLNNLANLISVKAHEKEGLELLFSTAPNVSHLLVGDPLRLGQVLINLANNAVKFTERGEIVVSTEMLKQDEDGVTLKFSVRDTGVGLTQEQISNLFQAFSQADSSTTRKYGGTGLGLTISKRLVNMMGGEIWVESEPGKGSTFSFTAAFGLGHENGKKRPLPSPDLRGMKVLVVDDNSTSREILQEMLESFSFEVTLAASGEEGLAELENTPENHPFELVIMDWKMPGMDGIEASRRIKKHTHVSKTPPIILVTAYGREEIMQKAEQAGIESFLIKPVSPSVLFDTIMQAFGKGMAERPIMTEGGVQEAEVLDSIRGNRVLLVEDNDINQQVAQEILAGVGLRVSLARNGQEAVDAVKEKSYDAVLMDVQMPVMDGYEATRQIREWEAEVRSQRPESVKQASNLPIIAMTAHAMAGDREKSLEAGMNDHISKPIDPQELYRTLNKWISRSDQEIPDVKRVEKKVAPGTTTAEEPIDFPDMDGINIEDGLARLLGNKKIYRKILLQFRNDFQNTAHIIKGLVSEEKYDEAENLAHSVKGASGNVGAEALQMEAATMEKWYKDGGKGLPEREFTAFSKELSRVMLSLAALGEVKEPAIVAKDEPEPLTPDIAKEVAQRLKSAVEVGDVMELGTIASELMAQSGASSHYGEMIEQLTNGFDFDGLIKLAKRLEEKATH